MNTVLKNFETANIELIKRKANRDALANVIAAKQEDITTLQKKAQMLGDGVVLMQTFSNSLQSDVISKFEELLTRGVRQVFQKDYKISIEFQTTGNSVYADFYVTLPDGKKINLANGEGGGLRDFVGILQRILYVVLEPSKPSKLLFLDENLKALDAERSPVAFKFIAELIKELGIQCLFITHSQAAKAMADVEGVNLVEVVNDGNGAQAKVVKA